MSEIYVKKSISCDVVLHTFRNAVGHAMLQSYPDTNNNDDDVDDADDYDVQVAKCSDRHIHVCAFGSAPAYKFHKF